MPEGHEALEDEALALLVRKGDERAAAILFARYDALLRKRTRRFVGRLGRKVGASDVLQETYLAAFDGIEAFEDRGPGSFRRWLAAIADHTAADQAKRHLCAGRDAKREVSVAPAATPPEPAADERTPSLDAMRGEDEAALRRALAAMSEDDRTVLRLVAQEGRGFPDAAQAMA